MYKKKDTTLIRKHWVYVKQLHFKISMKITNKRIKINLLVDTDQKPLMYCL